MSNPPPSTRAHWDALYAEADALADGGQGRRAHRMFLRAAESGDGISALRVGTDLTDGRGVERDVEEGLRWLRVARRLGAAPAANNIACTYAELGRWRLAVAWWERARVDDPQDDGILLAQCLLVGKGTRPDPVRGRGLLAAAVRAKSASAWDLEWAMALLGVTCAIGLGTPRSMARARTWLVRATADGDYPQAARVLAELGVRPPKPSDVARSSSKSSPAAVAAVVSAARGPR